MRKNGEGRVEGGKGIGEKARGEGRGSFLCVKFYMSFEVQYFVLYMIRSTCFCVGGCSCA